MIAKIIRFYLIVIMTAFFTIGLLAQTFVQENVAGIIIDSEEVLDPFVGGLNSPQISNADFNNDGIMDVMVFDRIGGALIPLISDGEEYIFDPSFVENFPVIENFLLMKDYNNDGIEDIFAYSVDPFASGISVFKGKYVNDRLEFDLVTSKHSDSLALPFQLASGSFSNIAVLNTDIPSIEDIDGDGDLDIVTFNFLGGSVEYYQNLVLERGESLDNFFFVKAEDCYGGIFESGFSQEIALPEFEGDCASGLQEGSVSTRHAGSTCLSIDYDADGDFELLLGDLQFNNITLLENGGDEMDAFFNMQILEYPDVGGEPVDIPIFPGAFYADIDGDEIRDFIAAPNNINNAFDVNNVWFYKNNGADDLPSLDLVKKDLFVENMLDLGTGTSPTFADVNGDDLLDMVIGTETTFVPGGDRDGRLYLFLNVGSKTNPNFELVDDNWLDFQRFNNDAFQFSPTFADLDQDGDLDLYVGERNGNIYHAENIAGPNAPMEFGFVIPNYLDLDVGQISSPIFYDYDKDGLLDLIVGTRNGNVVYYRNIGTASTPHFDYELSASTNNDFFGQIDTRIPGVITSHSKLDLISIDGKDFLVIGTIYGDLRLYEIGADPNAEFALVDTTLGFIRVGSQVDPAFADIDDDGLLEVLVGNKRGGLSSFSTDISALPVSTSPIISAADIQLRSNLVRDVISTDRDMLVSMHVFNTVGQLVHSGQNVSQLNVSNLLPGIYFVKLDHGGQSNTVKFVKQ